MHLAAGQQERAYFLLHRVPLYDISGVVAGIPEGGGARVQVEQGGLPVHGNFAETSGKFQLNAIPAGTYTVVAHGNDANGSELYAERQITLARDVSNLQLALGVFHNCVYVAFRKTPRKHALPHASGFPVHDLGINLGERTFQFHVNANVFGHVRVGSCRGCPGSGCSAFCSFCILLRRRQH